MKINLTLKLLPAEAANHSQIAGYIAKATGKSPDSVMGFTLLKQSIDARGKQPNVIISLTAFIDEPYQQRELISFNFPEVHNAPHRVLIVGAGPAGLFAALQLIELGIQPIIFERGKDVKSRRRDLASLNKEGILNPESNYCFGEGGAGTFSDGKLYTRSNKRGDINRILNLFVHFGAPENILYESHPHIGTNKLPAIITSMRKQIIASGGQILFEKKVTGLLINDDKIKGLITGNNESFDGDAVILATGHSARDIFQLLLAEKIPIEFKPFALGVRVEHPQSLIDNLQYRQPRGPGEFLPPAAYNLVCQVEGRSMFSFCMCPGGIIAPASTGLNELVVNGWSPSKRNNPFANSGMVVPVEEKDLGGHKQYGPLAGMMFQQEVEQKAYTAGGGHFIAPAQRLVDFTENKFSSTLPKCSYLPGLNPVLLSEVLPQFVKSALVKGFLEFGKRMQNRASKKGFLTNEAVVVATESRTSSPVRIPRDETTLAHPKIRNLYPCGEGAGYAGGIVSAAMDGERVAKIIYQRIRVNT
jgi:uncharacterized protein